MVWREAMVTPLCFRGNVTMSLEEILAQWEEECGS